MSEKLPLLACYAVLLFIAALSPWWSDRRSRVWRIAAGPEVALASRKWVVLAACFVFGFALISVGTAAAWLLVLAAAWMAFSGSRAIAFSRSGLYVAATAAACGLLLWWMPATEFPPGSALGAAIVAVLLGYVLRPAAASPQHGSVYAIPLAATAAAGLLVYLQPIEVGAQSLTAWHHWGAYLGAAESVAAGLTPFHDIPLQYGMGPTLLLLPAARSGGFAAMYWPVFVLTLAGLFAVITVCVDAVARSPREVQWCAAACAVVACLLWTAQPWDVGTAIMTPSTFGLRFAPALVLALVVTRPAPRAWAVWTAWAVTLLWSVESAFYAIAIYGSYRVFTRASGGGWREIVRVGLEVVAQAIGIYAVGVGVYWLAFGVFPSPRLFAFYALNPPGVLRVKWDGPVWWLGLVIVLGLLAMTRPAADSAARLRLYVCLMTCLAFASYYLGRSHDNNILNLMPAIVMLLCCVYAAVQESDAAAPVARLALATPLFLMPFFGFDGWPAPLGHHADAYSQRMAFGDTRYPDAARALKYVTEVRHESADVITIGTVYVALQGPKAVWNALHPVVNFRFATSEQRRKLLRVGMERFGKPGWLVVDRRLPDPEFVGDLLEVYTATETKEFGEFLAIRLSPPAAAAAERPAP